MDFNFKKYEDKFSPIIGQALLNFGNIEYFTMLALDYLPSERIRLTASKLDFTKRVDLIIELLNGRKESKSINRLIQLLKESKKLAVTRNIIAHNPLRIEIFEFKNNEMLDSHLIHYIDKKKKVTYQDIVDFSQMADSLAEELHDVFLKVISLQE